MWSHRFNSHVIQLRIGLTRLVFLLNIPFSKGDQDTDPAVAVQPTLQLHLVFKPHGSFNSTKVYIIAYLRTPSTHQETKDRSQNTKNAPACMPSTWTLQQQFSPLYSCMLSSNPMPLSTVPKKTIRWSHRFNSHVIWLRIGYTRLVFLLHIPFSKGDRNAHFQALTQVNGLNLNHFSP